MKILVTGANGYLGQGIVSKLINFGHEVIATDYKTNNINKNARLINANIFDIEDPYNFFDNPDIVVHLAWRDGFIHNSLNHITDLPKHYIFLKKMISSGCKHLVILGTMHEIWFYEGSVDETTLTQPQTLYGIAKNTLRQTIEIECKNNNVILQWLRAYYIIGNFEMGNSIFSKILQESKNNKKYFPFNTGKNLYDFLEYDTFCELCAQAICQDKITGIINVCNGYPQKLSDVVEEFINKNHLNIKLKYGLYPDREYDAIAIWGNNKKIRMIQKLYEVKE